MPLSFQKRLDDIRINSINVGSIIDRILNSVNVQYFEKDNDIIDKDGNITTFEFILEKCINIVTAYISCNKYTDSQIKIMNKYKQLLEVFKNNILDYDVCTHCARQLSVKTIKESRGSAFGFPKYEDVYKMKCNRCGYKTTAYSGCY